MGLIHYVFLLFLLDIPVYYTNLLYPADSWPSALNTYIHFICTNIAQYKCFNKIRLK